MNDNAPIARPSIVTQVSFVFFVVVLIGYPLLQWQNNQSLLRMGYQLELEFLTPLYYAAAFGAVIFLAISLGAAIIWRSIRRKQITFAATAILAGIACILLSLWSEDFHQQHRLFLQGAEQRLNDEAFTKKSHRRVP